MAGCWPPRTGFRSRRPSPRRSLSAQDGWPWTASCWSPKTAPIPSPPRGTTDIPNAAYWEETIEVFRASGRVVSVFVDKHLADNWDDAKVLYDTARELKIPLMAGTSAPGTWRHPPADVARDARITEIVALTYGTTDAYGFHALEAVQALAAVGSDSSTPGGPPDTLSDSAV